MGEGGWLIATLLEPSLDPPLLVIITLNQSVRTIHACMAISIPCTMYNKIVDYNNYHVASCMFVL